MAELPKKQTTFYICGLLTAITFSVYMGLMRNDFIIYDDNVYVTANINVQNGATFSNIKWAFTTNTTGNWHPITWLSHIIDFELFGLRAWGHHLTSLMLHIANVLLLFLILKWMTGAVWRSAFVAAVFAVHPLNVESVAWVAERKNVLSTLFWLLTIAAYVKYTKAKTAGWYLAVVFLFGMGLMTKPMLVTVPFVLLLLDYWPLERIENFRDRKALIKTIVEKIPFFFMSAISSIITFDAQRCGGAIVDIHFLPIQKRIYNAIVSYAGYIEKMFWPSKLAVIYPYPLNDKIQVLKLAAGAGVLILLSIILIVLLRKYRYLTAGWLWYLGTLVPVIGLVQVGKQSMADRYTYVPLIGLFIMIGWAAADLSEKRRHQKVVLGLISVITICVLSIITTFQIRYWHDSISLFEHAVKVTKNNDIAYSNLGSAFGKAGRNEEALSVLLKGMEIQPKNLNIYYSLGVIYTNMGRYGDAIEIRKKIVKIKPDDFKILNDLAANYVLTGNYKAAIEACRRAIELKPDYAEAYYTMGCAYQQTGSFREATEAYEKAIKLEPSLIGSYYNLADIYRQTGRSDEAIKIVENIMRDYSGNEEAYYNLGLIYGQTGNYQKAVDAFKKAIEIKKDYSDVYFNLGLAYDKLKRYEDEAEAYKQVIKLKPDHIDAYYNMGLAYGNMGQDKQAAEAFREVVRISPDYAQGHYNLGFALYSSGDKEAAMEQYKILKGLNAEMAEKLLADINSK